MSTRVQKGSTVFRPVSKARARLGSEVRQTSATPDASSASRNNHGTPAASAASSSMPPPSMIPHRSQLSSTGDLSSNDTSENAGNSNSRADAPDRNASSTFAISVPTRSGARPPAIQSFTAPRVSTPVPPRAHNGNQKHPSSSVSRQTVPIAMAALSRGVQPPVHSTDSPVITSGFQHEQSPGLHANPHTMPLVSSFSDDEPSSVGIPTITNAQIDPALLQAVVTALQHVNQAESQPLQSAEAPVEGSAHQEARPRPRLRSRARSQTQPDKSSDGAGPSGAASIEHRAPSPTGDEVETHSSDEDNDASFSKRKRKKRDSNGTDTPRKRRSRAPSVPPYDPNADPGEELDPTAVTMAELCDDTGRGRVSSKAIQIMTNHAAWRAGNREKRARMRAIMEAKKYGRNPDADDDAPSQAAKTPEADTDDENSRQPVAGPSSSRAQSAEAEPEPEGQRGDDYDYTQAMSTSRYHVQVRIGPNGETIIDETSLVVDRQEEDETANYTHIEESDTTKFVNSMSYSKKLRGSRWSAEETELFFDALSQFGENYELISYVLPGRDRKACKNKFKAEDKRNPIRITYCLKNKRPYDMQTLSRMTGKDFSGPTPEIRAPTPLRLPQGGSGDAQDNNATSVKVRKQSATPGLADPTDPDEVLELEEIDAGMASA